MRPTREGSRFLLATLLIGLASFNTGNNLIYLIFAMMTAILAASFLLLWLNLRGLRIHVSLTTPVFASWDTQAELTITNTRRLLPAYSVRIAFPEGIAGEGFLAYVPAGGSAAVNVQVAFPRRGIVRYSGFTASSSFPFIFFTGTRRLRSEGEVLVYPEIIEIIPIDMAGGAHGTETSMRKGKGDELLSIRAYRDGDDMKHVHWKATARAGAVMVREFAEETPSTLTIVLDNTLPVNESDFERAVSYAASLAWKMTVNEGFFVSLVTCNRRLPFGNGLEQACRILDHLAVIEPENAWDCPMPREGGFEGMSVLVLASEASVLRPLAPECDMVIHAASL
jgi:uncharacterized protein (DUF58 family)